MEATAARRGSEGRKGRAEGCHDLPLGRRGAASGRSSASSRRLCRAHSSAIAGSHRRVADATAATYRHCDPAGQGRGTIAHRRLRSPRDPRRDDRVRHGAIVAAGRLAPPPGRLPNFDRRRRRAGADVCFEGWGAAEWIGASDGPACDPRNSACATPRRPALLIAERRAGAESGRIEHTHRQRRAAPGRCRRPQAVVQSAPTHGKQHSGQRKSGDRFWAQARATNYWARPRSGRPLFGEALAREG